MQSPIESDLLRTFIAVAETNNFTKAADLVGRTQSAVSMQIKKLEDGIGVSLFERGSRGVSLTPHGNMLLTRARRVVMLLDETATSMRASSLSGSVRVGIPEELGSSVLPIALRKFDELHPGVEITANFGRSAANTEAVNAGRLDIAVVYEEGQKTVSEILMSDPTVWVTSDVHETHLRSPLPIGMFSGSGWCRAASLEALRNLDGDYRVAYVSDTSNGLIASVQAGLGIAPLSRSSIPDNCRELTLEEGFAIIDHSNVTLRISRRNRGPAVLGMAQAIREAVMS